MVSRQNLELKLILTYKYHFISGRQLILSSLIGTDSRGHMIEQRARPKMSACIGLPVRARYFMLVNR